METNTDAGTIWKWGAAIINTKKKCGNSFKIGQCVEEAGRNLKSTIGKAYLKQVVSRNMGIKGASSEDSEKVRSTEEKTYAVLGNT